jgi:hypothetical protein
LVVVARRQADRLLPVLVLGLVRLGLVLPQEPQREQRQVRRLHRWAAKRLECFGRLG